MTAASPVRRISLLAALGGSVMVFTAAAGCSFKPPGAAEAADTEGDQDEERAAPVVVAPVSRADMEAKIAASSTIEAELGVSVHAETTGRVTGLTVNEGDVVEEGDLLATLRRDAQSTSVKRANVSVEKAQLDYDRIKALYAKGAASKEELDNAEITLRNANLDYNDRRRDLGNTKVRAPFSGVVTERLIDAGAFVTSGQQLMSITDFSTLVARVYVPERELDRISVGQDARVVGKAAKGREGEGTVMRIAPIVDAATGTVKVTVSLPEALSGGDDGFLPGMYAEVTLTTERHENVVVLPKTALVHQEEQTFAFVVDDDHAKRVKLEIGLQDDERVEVLSGVEEGDMVIIAGQSGLKDGALVQLVDASGKPIDGPNLGVAASDGAVAAADGEGA